jgi:asparagine synthase (glutamine-hydrolysing)
MIAERGRVREVRFDALDPRGDDDGAAPRATEAWHEALWEEIARATRDRSRRGRRACVALSGGLDSTAVAVAALRTRASLDAFSMLVDGAAGKEERRLVRLFCAEHPPITPHVIDVTHTSALGDLASLPLTDDPVVTGPAFTGARAALFRAIQAAGFDAVLDGEGGDEIFDLAVRLHDVARARDWRNLALHLRGRERVRLRATVWRQLVVPSLPRPLLGLWLARERRRLDPVPPWMNRAFRDREATRAAVGRAFRRPLARYDDAIAHVLACASNVAARQSLGALRRAHGLEALSPLLDRRVIELVARMPAHLRIDPRHSKGLLRNASRGILPEAIRWSPKENGPYEKLQLAGLADGPAVAERLARLEGCAPIRDFVDVRELQRTIAACARRGEAALPTYRTREKVYALLALGAWHARVRETYGLD